MMMMTVKLSHFRRCRCAALSLINFIHGLSGNELVIRMMEHKFYNDIVSLHTAFEIAKGRDQENRLGESE